MTHPSNSSTASAQIPSASKYIRMTALCCSDNSRAINLRKIRSGSGIQNSVAAYPHAAPARRTGPGWHATPTANPVHTLGAEGASYARENLQRNLADAFPIAVGQARDRQHVNVRWVSPVHVTEHGRESVIWVTNFVSGETE